MGKLDFNNYVVEVKLRDNISDRRFDAVEEMKPTIKEYTAFEKKLISESPVYSDKAEKLIRFFVDYKGGLLKPEHWNFYEPVRNILDANSIMECASCLASPGGEVYLNKKRGQRIIISNKTYGICWEDGQFVSAKSPLPEYLTIIRVFFSIHKNTDVPLIIQLMKDIKETFGADNGRVYIQSTNETIAE